jgi:uncharacterized protein
MGHRFAELAFTPSVRAVQEAQGSRANYTRLEEGPPSNSELTRREAEFIAERDSFYMASVSETGWPYVQHRGGPAGFIKVLAADTVGFADYRGNRQYVSVGNILKNERVSLILLDYTKRTRLKLLGHARLVGSGEADLLAGLQSPDYKAKVERGFLIKVAAFDWNCPQHITPRFTAAQVEAAVEPLREKIRHLEDRIEQLTAASRAAH